jgi:hypothetical protein
MRSIIILAGLAAASSLAAQARPPAAGKPLGSWDVEYDRTITHMHGEATHQHDHGRMTLRTVGDSVIGELVIGDSTTGDRSVLRGVSGKTGMTLYAEAPRPQGAAIFFSALGSAMDWLRENVHGIQPVLVRFDLSVKGDSLTGSRIVTGGVGNGAGGRASPIYGKRAK